MPSGKIKTSKTISKRIKVTKTGKLLKRCAGQDHYNGKQTGNKRRKKLNDKKVSKAFSRTVKELI